jgi:hypothetical protein
MPEATTAPVPMPPMPSGTTPTPAGPTGPATTTPSTGGMEARAPMLADVALKIMREMARVLDPVSPKGQALHKAMSILAKEFGAPSTDLTRADMKLLGEKSATATPSNPAAFADMMRQVGANRAGQPAPALAPQTPATAGA